MIGVRARIIFVLGALMLSPLPAQAATIPTASVLVAPSTWAQDVTSITATSTFSAGGNWRADLISRCTGLVAASKSGTLAKAGVVSATFSRTDVSSLVAGPYKVSITPLSSSNEVGTAVTQSVNVASNVTSKTRNETVCTNARRLVIDTTAVAPISAQVLASRAAYPDATNVILVGYDEKNLGYMSVAAVYARMRGIPMLYTDPKALSKSVLNELTRRHATKVYIVGSTSLVSSQVAADLKAKNFVYSRFNVTTASALASKLFTSKFVAPGTPAVYVNMSSSKRYLLEATAFASATNRPLLPVSGTVPSEVTAMIDNLKLDGGVAIGSALDIPQSALTQIKGVSRLATTDELAQTLALARTATKEVPTILLYAKGAKANPANVGLLMSPALPFAISSSGLNVSQRRYLNARGDVTSIVSTDTSSNLPDDAIASVAAVLIQRGPTQIPILEPAALGDFTPPATFAFSGSGFGHGIGLSQWGAYAMATAGMTAEDILTHYFPTTTVGDVVDTNEMHVGLQSRISTLKLRVAAIEGGTPHWVLLNSDGDKITIDSTNIVTFKYDAKTDLVKATISGTPESLPAAQSISIFWSGTRYASRYDMDTTAAKVQVIGPGESTSTGRWYRYGWMRVGGVAASSTAVAGMTVVNSVRLHSEYLYGLGEVPSSWPAEALRAQVIAARGYAYNRAFNSDGTARSRSASCDCTIPDGADAQVFVGWSKLAETAGPRWKAAVDASLTSSSTGQVVKSGDKVIQTFFSSATGGATQNNQDVWGGTPQRYWQSVDDPWSISDVVDQKIAAWQPRVRPQAFMASIFGLASVYYVDLSERYVSGAIKTARAYGKTPGGSLATVAMSASAFRLAMGRDLDTTDNTDPYDSLPSEYVWRTSVTLKGADLAEQSANLVNQRSLVAAATAASKATTAVIVAQPNSENNPQLFLAAAYAGNKSAALYTARSASDATRLKTALVSRGITSVVTIGTIDVAITNALTSAKISVRNISGISTADLSRKLAIDLNPTAATGVVVVSESEPEAWTLATSVSARTGKPIVVVTDGAFTPEISQWITTLSPADIIMVGSAVELPDNVVAGFAKASRLNTTDLPLASITALQFGGPLVRAIVTTSATSSVNQSVVAASLGLPVLYSSTDTVTDSIDWLRRKSLVAAIVDVNADADFVLALRRA
jgi:SpoIID/LytB domain protein